ncbi:shikimate kinase [Alicyclobacillus contaminans]|uniref:shikimate kinase n=1 Tax=Alicyclobacillus contaminans TaxID=392016 RepID=UPI00041B96EC|nr:shikimate kinase [Alicyclobacillus contaminans]
MRQSIALVGMMGVGKSTVGRAVAVAMQAQYVDLDEWVEAHSGKPIWKLFKDDGEAAFRQWEAKGLRQLTEEASDQRYVLSTGGGVVGNPGNRALLQSRWLTVWLDASPATLLRRVQRDGPRRPLLENADPLGTLTKLGDVRRPWYEACSRLRIVVDDQSIDETAAAVVEWVTRLQNA